MVTSGCKLDASGDEFDFESLVGLWIFEGAQSTQYETWQQLDDGSFSGRGYVIESGDTTFIETLQILRIGDIWTYRARVSDSDDAETVDFRLTRQSDRKVEFRNDAYDFPKKIGYEFLSPEELLVYIEGPRDGQNIRVLFDFKKEK